MDQTTTTAPVNPAGASAPVINMTGARAKRAEQASKVEGEKRAPSVELQYARHLLWRTDIAIGGMSANGCVDLSLHRWTGTYWSLMQPEVAEKECLDWIEGVCPSRHTSRTAASAVATASRKLLGASERDISKMIAARGVDAIIPTQDGYLRIKKDGSISLETTDKNLGITHCVPARIDITRVQDGIYMPAPVPESSSFGAYLARFLPDPEVRSLVQEACASTLLPVNFEKAIVLDGSGSNGKSTLLHILRALHPSNASFRLTQAGSRFGNQSIPGKTLILVTEGTSFIGDEAEQNLKALISRDPLEIERKNRDSITITPRASLVIALNKPLRFTDRTYGSMRKYLHIPFTVRLPDGHPDRIMDYHKRITDDAHEMSIVMDWLLAGAQRLLARGRLPEPPPAVASFADELRMETDTVFAWSQDREVRTHMERLSSKTLLYQDYVDTVRDEGGKPVGAPEFWRTLKEIVGGKLSDCQRRADGYGKRERYVNLVADGVASISDPFPY